MDYTAILAEIADECRPLARSGRVADYIAPLAAVGLGPFGMALRTVEGEEFSVGDAAVPFSIQSIAKVLGLAHAMELVGDDIWSRVGREPSGTPFNSLVQLETERGIPRNPMINAGALVVVDATLAAAPSNGDHLLAFVRRAADDETLGYDLAVAEAERETAHGNRALAHLLKAYGVLQGDPDAVIDAYCRMCSLSMSCAELCRAFTFLARAGLSPSGARVVSPRHAKRINAVMLTCGVYDEAGDFAYRVGLPAKSGVGGGIVAVLPGVFVATVWSPGLGPKGNSLAGTMALELLTTKTGASIF
ncbi:glutaminase [Rubricoccus marinus]|uniref:Glutaminase n=1 Tax=Rubricoccus marinus TaxID=716817 RepID=A0A259TVK4_9BACT|nr:glutaminase [Rubricoccus marinus]OZC01736.1 glutaminase [Rubricoccus marinus]